VNKYIKTCEYKFKAKYVCLNGKACIEKVKAPFLGSKQATTYKVDCKCPLKNSFKFGPNYCTTDLEACDYLKLNAVGFETFYFISIIIATLRKNT
jgi:hypothetical protein